ncbi:MAG TPA: Bax inhibitor-1/YccA family protein [Cyclobacteriaceae bacterium]|nr:Bax inhibitor-1/YccA family protein [Cyclobacteriaceae bacterium]
MSQTSDQAALDAAAETQRFMTAVYGWMSFALVITGLVAMYTASKPELLNLVFGNTWGLIAVVLLEFIAVAVLVSLLSKLNSFQATLIFILYSALNGLTLSGIFVVYTAESIEFTFYITAGTFAAMSLYGYTTKNDLSGWGSFLSMGLIGLIIASFVSILFDTSAFSWITSCFGVATFVGLTAYDTQKIKAMNIIGNEGTDEDRKEAIMGALELYLDFINMFLYLLRLFGDRK